jgi:hypothetical protein
MSRRRADSTTATPAISESARCSRARLYQIGPESPPKITTLKHNTMKTKILGALVAGLVTLTGIPQAGEEEKLVLGKDRIDVPAIGAGL